MTKFYTIIGFGFIPISDTDTSWNARRGVRSYKTRGAAKGALKQADLPKNTLEDIQYRILETVVRHDGTVETAWVA